MSVYFQFNRQIWERDHISDYKPIGWQCGKCGVGQLKFNVTAKLLKERKTKSFSCHLRCTNPDCDIPHHAAGNWGKYNASGGEISMEYRHDDYRRHYYPLVFVPTLELFSCSAATPIEIIEELQEPFKLFWLSPAACANAIRRVLERIMDMQSIPEGKLHGRLEKFSQQTTINIKHLMAIKLIGNDGSHSSNLHRMDAIDGFELLAKVLSVLYPDNSQEQRLNNMAESISSSKKPRSKQSED